MRTGSDYDERDLEKVLDQGHWKSWSQVIKWLSENGAEESGLPPDEVKAIRDDLISIREAAVPFTDNPREAFRLVHHPHEG